MTRDEPNKAPSEAQPSNGLDALTALEFERLGRRLLELEGFVALDRPLGGPDRGYVHKATRDKGSGEEHWIVEYKHYRPGAPLRRESIYQLSSYQR